MLWWIIGGVVVVAGFGVWLLFRWADRVSREGLHKAPIWYMCIWCDTPFIPKDTSHHLPSCTNCGQTTNISGQQAFSEKAWKEGVTEEPVDVPSWMQAAMMGTDKPEAWVLMAEYAVGKKNYSGARNCLNELDNLPESDDEELRAKISEISQVLRKRDF